MKANIAIIGEYHSTFEPHTALNRSLDDVQSMYEFDYEWVDTLRVEREGEFLLNEFAGFWSAPGSPFKSLEGALSVINYARVKGIPHLGTCAGFQHAVIELARNVLGIEEAQHEEYDAQSSTLFINRLTCSLAGKSMEVFLKQGTLTHSLYGVDKTEETYYCNFGINPMFRESLRHPQIAVSGIDQDKEIRIIELPNHRFFVITLFVPQTRSMRNQTHPLIRGFVEAVCGR